MSHARRDIEPDLAACTAAPQGVLRELEQPEDDPPSPWGSGVKGERAVRWGWRALGRWMGMRMVVFA